jgi:hypothetical protein
MSYTLDQAIAAACDRARRDREGSFAVILDDGGILVQDAKAVRPMGSKVECIVQFWSECEDGTVQVQIRSSGATSEWRSFEP